MQAIKKVLTPDDEKHSSDANTGSRTSDVSNQATEVLEGHYLPSHKHGVAPEVTMLTEGASHDHRHLAAVTSASSFSFFLLWGSVWGKELGVNRRYFLCFSP